MKLADRIAAWFGYEPIGRNVMYYDTRSLRRVMLTDTLDEPPTKSEAQVIVSADLKQRKRPCS